MAGNKNMPPAQVYVVISGHYEDVQATIQGAYVDHDAAMMAANDNVELLHVVPVNYNGVDGAPIENTNGGASAKAKPKSKAAKTNKSSTAETATKTNSRKKAVPDGNPGSLDGQTIASCGTLRTMDLPTFQQAVEKFGGSHTKKFTEASYIVLGEKPGPKQLEEINNGGYQTMSEEEFHEEIGADFAPPAKRAKKE